MYKRLAVISIKLNYYGLNTRADTNVMLQRMSGNLDSTPLKVLAAVVEPPKEYAREELRSYNSFTPLNRLVDAVPPESATVREFNELTERIVAGKATP